MSPIVTIIGAGLAGCEAAHQVARRGFKVRLFEMRPEVKTDVHHGGRLADLVCSNSLRSDDPFHPVGLIKREMAGWDSLIIGAARRAAVPAGSALAVDREGFSQGVNEGIEGNPNIELIREEVTAIPDGPVILAAGPLCSEALSQDLYRFVDDKALYFYDAIAPVVEYDSLDHDIVYLKSRYDKGEGADYLNIPLDKETYERFHHELVTGERVAAKNHEKLIFFEGCLPVEVMADRGVDTLRFGPLKPVGLEDPRTGEQPYAVIQLRQDNFAKSHWNMVGFQTQLKWGEQKRVFQMLPGMEKARFVRYGMIHRNTYVDSSKHLLPTLQFRQRADLFLAGQISGVEGYVESAAAGLMAGVNMACFLAGESPTPFPATTAMGALAHYVSFAGHGKLDPTNINFGLLPPLARKRRMKRREKRAAMVRRAVTDMIAFAQSQGLTDFALPDYEEAETLNAGEQP